MAGIPRKKVGALVYECVTANLGGGTVVVPAAGATLPGKQGMVAAGDAAPNVLGVNINDCVTAANQATLQYPTGPAPMLAQGLDLTIPEITSTVENDAVVPVVYTAAAVNYGDPLCSAAGGKVRKFVNGTDPTSALLGWCAQVGGVSAAGGVALARINR